jgi:hypothetical protein
MLLRAPLSLYMHFTNTMLWSFLVNLNIHKLENLNCAHHHFQFFHRQICYFIHSYKICLLHNCNTKLFPLVILVYMYTLTPTIWVINSLSAIHWKFLSLCKVAIKWQVCLMSYHQTVFSCHNNLNRQGEATGHTCSNSCSVLNS